MRDTMKDKAQKALAMALTTALVMPPCVALADESQAAEGASDAISVLAQDDTGIELVGPNVISGEAAQAEDAPRLETDTQTDTQTDTPAATQADTEDAPAIDSWYALQDAIDDAPSGTPTTITLTQDLEGTVGNEISIPAGKVITIDMAGHTLRQKSKYRRVFTNSGKLSLVGGGTIMADVEGSALSERGGAIYNARRGVLDIEGCSIEGAVASQDGGGLYNDGTATLTDVTLKNNKASEGNGGGVCNAGKLTMTRTTIADGSSKENGAGLCNMTGGDVVMNECTVSGNEMIADSKGSGAGIYSKGSLTLNGGEIHHNSGENGGGICMEGAETLYVNGTNIHDNVSRVQGGGIRLGEDASLALKDAVVKDNTAKGWFGGICLSSSGTFTIEGATVVEGNKAISLYGNDVTNNIQLTGDKKIAFSGPLAESASMGVSMGDMSGIGCFTEGFAEHNGDSLPRDFFHSDDERCMVCKRLFDGECHMAKTADSWSKLNTLIKDADCPTIICLTADLSAGEKEAPITIASGKTIRLELEGHTIDRNLYSAKDNGGAIENDGELTICEGCVKGGYTTGDGGGIWNQQHGNLTVENVLVGNSVAQGRGGALYNSNKATLGEGVRLAGNRCDGEGGGVLSLGRMTIKDGVTIEANIAGRNGGGIFNMGIMNISDARVINNESCGNGGGIYDEGSQLLLLGKTEISKNAVVRGGFGGGVYSAGERLAVGDSIKVLGNSAFPEKGKNLFLSKGKKIRFEHPLVDDAKMGVTLQADTGVFTVGYAKANGDTDPAHFFVEDGWAMLHRNKDGEVEIAGYGTEWFNKVTFVKNAPDGSVDERSEQKVKEGESAWLKKNAFTCDGYVFTGWNTKADGTGEAYADHCKVTPEGDMTLYAQWQALSK